MKKYIILLLFFSSLFSYSQVILQGKISLSENNKIHTEAGINIYWQDTTIGTTTDENGHFKLIYKPEYKNLIISYIGYKTQIIYITNPMNFISVLLKEDTNELEGIEINIKQKNTERLALKTANIININSGELLKAACCNLSDSFETNSTVDIAVSDAITGTKQIKMLGLSSPYVLITQENVPYVRGASQVFGMTFSPGTWIESIQMVKGAGSVINGYEGIAGQINTELIKPMLDKPIYLNFYSSQDGRFELNSHFNKKISKHWYSGLYIHGNIRNTRDDMNNDGFLDIPIGNQINIMNRWQYANQETGWLSNIILQFLTDERTAGQTQFHKNHSSLWGSFIKTDQFNTMAKLGYIWKDLPFQSIGFQLDYKYYNQNSSFGQSIYNIGQHSIFANALFKSIIGNTNHKFTTGISGNFDKYDEFILLKYVNNNYNRNDYGAGAFFEYAFDNLENISLTAGLRADFHNQLGAFLTPRFHFRYIPWENGTLRLSMGRGKRIANIFAENQKVFYSNRSLNILPSNGKIYGLNPEIAWNYGISFVQNLKLNNKNLELSFDFYRTDFQNQVVVDWDNPRELSFYNLKGKSFANSLQIEANYEIINRLHLRLAYKWYNVETDYNSGRKWQPLQAKHRAMANISYETPITKEHQWRFDYTFNAIGQQRLPETFTNPKIYQLNAYSNAYTLSNAQITRVFSKRIEAYLGAENIFNYQQTNPILSSETPFGTFFDASITYAPVFGRMIYMGLRFQIK